MFRRAVIILAVIMLLAACSAPAEQTPSAADAPRIAEDFQLRDQNGQPFELYKFEAAPAIVLLTHVNGDPVSRASVVALRELRADPATAGVVVALLNSTPGVTRQQLKDEAAATGVSELPFLLDGRQFVGETLGVVRGGEAIVVDPKRWAIIYRGPVDGRFAAKASGASLRASVKEALGALTAGRSVKTVFLDSSGASIRYPVSDNRTIFARITYTRDVAPILLDKCVVCHVGGGVAPFAMTDYAAVRPFSFMIRESVRTDRMPPIDAPRQDGPYAHMLSLTDAEAKTLVHWAEGGGARGEGDDILAALVKPLPTLSAK